MLFLLPWKTVVHASNVDIKVNFIFEYLTYTKGDTIQLSLNIENGHQVDEIKKVDFVENEDDELLVLKEKLQNQSMKVATLENAKTEYDKNLAKQQEVFEKAEVYEKLCKALSGENPKKFVFLSCETQVF